MNEFGYLTIRKRFWGKDSSAAVFPRERLHMGRGNQSLPTGALIHASA